MEVLSISAPLAEEENICYICKEPFGTGDNPEKPVTLPVS